jgi:16S rRNA (cytidine1402-2'-O)-methyltransferase
LQEINDTLTFFETPHRIGQTLSEMANYLVGRPIMLARELTKRHQELLKFDDAAAIGRVPKMKGEFTVVVGPRPTMQVKQESISDELIYSEFCRMTSETGGGRRSSLSAVAHKYGRSAKEVYAIVERFKHSDADRA